MRGRSRRATAFSTAMLAVALCPIALRAQTRAGWDWGIEVLYYRYDEPQQLAPPLNTLDESYGPAGGLAYDFTGTRGGFFFRSESEVDFSALHYYSPASGREAGIPDVVGETRLVSGHDFAMGPGLFVSPYSGLGYRILYQAFDGGRLDQYLYIPLGVTVGVVRGEWTLKPTAEYDLFLHGWQKTDLEGVGFSNDVHFDQSSGYGLRGSLIAERDTRLGRLLLGPFVRYWKINGSNQQPSTGPACFGQPNCNGGPVKLQEFHEPNNTTVELGLTAKLAY